MSLTREQVLAEIQKIVDESKPQPNDIYIQDLIDIGMDNATAGRYLNGKVDSGELVMVFVNVNGRRRNAYRPVG